MGRGRQKAKQTKVARELKYQTLSTDFTALERELGGKGRTSEDDPEKYANRDGDSAGADDDDPYAAYYDEDDEDDEDAAEQRG